ncbi:hypothetical protein FNV43_RR07297 [Rhamnella rubrinervis]|uniref:Uncharacterized protein n=1 Tax=Rhamnella rubrinervis TaxID=2594499 RepID=A0A8K0MM96_9ROSA|nr:hypothetical protein FNV43_RR07297 [Rhamnella rubrinervis]
MCEVFFVPHVPNSTAHNHSRRWEHGSVKLLTSISDNLSSDREVYEYGGNEVEYSGDTNDGGSIQDASGEDDSSQIIRGNPQDVEGFAITEVKSSFKTAEHLRKLLLPFDMNTGVIFRVPERNEDPSKPKAGEAVFHTAFFKNGLRLPLLPVF